MAQSKGSLPRSARKPAAGNLSIATFVLRTVHCSSSGGGGGVGGKWGEVAGDDFGYVAIKSTRSSPNAL